MVLGLGTWVLGLGLCGRTLATAAVRAAGGDRSRAVGPASRASERDTPTLDAGQSGLLSWLIGLAPS